MADIALINPRFEVSYWGMEHALSLLGKRSNMPVAALPLLAALTPREHRVSLFDENIAPLDFDRLARADIVGVTGMSVQRQRTREILAELKRRGAFTVVGGPWVSVHEDYFGALADVIFIGEAEETWPAFLKDFARGAPARRYEQAERTDMSKVPPPRYDLLEMDEYAFGSVQFSRGCPFQCEFCDIIVTFGRRPRLKTAPQILAELDALAAARARFAFIVDDNLIGNKRAIKPLLREVIAWQERRGYPLSFFTEASLDLAEDRELLQLMVDANIVCVFVGIESPNEDALRETKKLQNLRGGGDAMLDRVRRIQEAGLEVWCGLILGFDSDDTSVFEAQRRFVSDSGVVHAMLGMLTAIPKTPLYDRLAKEGRLDPEDRPEFGTNVIPRRMSREELRAGYVGLLNALYEPEAYFARFEELYLTRALSYSRGRERYFRRHPARRVRHYAESLAAAGYLAARLFGKLPAPALRREYWRRLLKLLRHRAAPELLVIFLIKCAMHYHAYTMAKQMRSGDAPIRNTF